MTQDTKLGWELSGAMILGQALSSRFDKMNLGATNLSSREALYQHLIETHPTRHAAVHRLLTRCEGAERMLKRGLDLIVALRDSARTTKMREILQQFQATNKSCKSIKTTSSIIWTRISNKLRENGRLWTKEREMQKQV